MGVGRAGRSRGSSLRRRSRELSGANLRHLLCLSALCLRFLWLAQPCLDVARLFFCKGMGGRWGRVTAAIAQWFAPLLLRPRRGFKSRGRAGSRTQQK